MINVKITKLLQLQLTILSGCFFCWDAMPVLENLCVTSEFFHLAPVS